MKSHQVSLFLVDFSHVVGLSAWLNVGPARHAQCGVSSTVGQALADLNLDKNFQVFKFRATATDANQFSSSR